MISADDKHVKAVIQAADEEQDSKDLSVTGAKEEHSRPEDEVGLAGAEVKRFRAIGSTGNGLRSDRPDIQYGAK